MQQYRKCCTHPIGVSVYKWVSERGSRSAAADVAFQRELVEFIRRKICSPCHAGSSESRTVNRSALMENNGSPSIFFALSNQLGRRSGQHAQRAFPEPAEPTGLMTLHAFSVSDCYAESSTPRPCVTDVGDAGPWIAHRTVARANFETSVPSIARPTHTWNLALLRPTVTATVASPSPSSRL